MFSNMYFISTKESLGFSRETPFLISMLRTKRWKRVCKKNSKNLFSWMNLEYCNFFMDTSRYKGCVYSRVSQWLGLILASQANFIISKASQKQVMALPAFDLVLQVRFWLDLTWFWLGFGLTWFCHGLLLACFILAWLGLGLWLVIWWKSLVYSQDVMI